MDERRSPLETWTSLQYGGVFAVRELPFLAQLTVRARDGGSLLPAVNEVATWTRPGSGDGAAHVLGLGPDEWLVVAAPTAADSLEADFSDVGSIVDVSAQRTTLELTGAAVRQVLAHGCALDLHPTVFGVGRCAQTMLAHAQVIIWHYAPDEFRVLVRPSFAVYL